MAQVAMVLAVLALADVVACGIAASVFYARTLATIGPGDPKTKWLAAVTWLSVQRRLTGAAAAHAANVNKAIVAFLVCVVVAVAPVAIALNLQRLAR
jgi:hypothetical protein